MKIKFVVIDCEGRGGHEIGRYDTYEEAEAEITRLCSRGDLLGSQEYKIEKRWRSE